MTDNPYSPHDPHNPHEGFDALTPAGLARKREIIAAAQTALARRAHRRTVHRSIGAIAIMAAGVAWLLPRSAPAPALPIPSIASQDRAVPPTPLIQIVRTDPRAVEAMIVRSARADPATYIDDAELSKLLAEAGEPPGIIRTPGRVLLARDLQPQPPRDAPGSPSGV